MGRCVEKVTAFVTCGSGDELRLLLFEHPSAGIQIPAGTVEEGETPEEAARREVAEETGLVALPSHRYLDAARRRLSDEERIICKPTKVYARPNETSFDWAYLRTGIRVIISRTQGGFSQVTYREHDREPQPRFETMRITGWVPDSALAADLVRHFYLFSLPDCTSDRWSVFADHHTFVPFWAPIAALPQIISPQDQWLEILRAALSSPAGDDADRRAVVATATGTEGSGLVVRPYRASDEQTVIRLWRDVFPGAPPWNDPLTDIQRKLEIQRELFLVAALGGEVVGTAMAGYDGHRGWVYYLAVDRRHHRQGIGSELMASLEKRLSQMGCPKVNLQVRPENQAVVSFYEHHGYTAEDRISMAKRLAPH